MQREHWGLGGGFRAGDIGSVVFRSACPGTCNPSLKDSEGLSYATGLRCYTFSFSSAFRGAHVSWLKLSEDDRMRIYRQNKS